MKTLYFKYLNFIITLFLFLQKGTDSKCQDYISNMTGFQCLDVLPFLEYQKLEFYRVKREGHISFMRVAEPTLERLKEKRFLEMFEQTENVMKIDRYIINPDSEEANSETTNKIIHLTKFFPQGSLAETLWKRPNFFEGSEERVINFFIKLLKTVGEIHDSGYVLRNLSLDSVFVDFHGNPMIQDMRETIVFGKKIIPSKKINIYMTVEEAKAAKEGLEFEYTGWSDYYAIGVMLYQIVFGKAPLDLENLDYQTALHTPIDFWNIKGDHTVFTKLPKMTQKFLIHMLQIYKDSLLNYTIWFVVKNSNKLNNFGELATDHTILTLTDPRQKDLIEDLADQYGKHYRRRKSKNIESTISVLDGKSIDHTRNSKISSTNSSYIEDEMKSYQEKDNRSYQTESLNGNSIISSKSSTKLRRSFPINIRKKRHMNFNGDLSEINKKRKERLKQNDKLIILKENMVLSIIVFVLMWFLTAFIFKEIIFACKRNDYRNFFVVNV